MQATIRNVNVEQAPNGKKYQVAKVQYIDENGAEKKTQIMSFANPAVFSAVQGMIGQVVDVETVQSGAFLNWAAIKPAANQTPTYAPNPPDKPTVSKVIGSNYETPVERARKQVLIVRQSSVTSAIAYHTAFANDPDSSLDEVLKTAERIVDFVFKDESLEKSNQPAGNA